MLTLLPFCPLWALDETDTRDKIQWGTDISNYKVWNWMDAYGDKNEETPWDELERQEQDKRLKKAEAACSQAEQRLYSTNNQTDGDAMLALSRNNVKEIGVCLQNGKAIAAALEKKCLRLAQIRVKAQQNRYEQADMLWLKENNIRLSYKSPAKDKAAIKADKIAKQAQKKRDEAAKKYQKAYGNKLNDNKLAEMYDNSKAVFGDTESSIAYLKNKELSAPWKTGTKAKTVKSVTVSKPADPSVPAWTGKWKGKTLDPATNNRVLECQKRSCSLPEALTIVDPVKMQPTPPNRTDKSNPRSVAKLEKDFQGLVGRKLDFDKDLLPLRADDGNRHPTGFESNTLGSLEHKYFVDSQKKAAIQNCPGSEGGIINGVCAAGHAVVQRVLMPVAYEIGKAYMVVEREAYKGNPLAVVVTVTNYPLGTILKAGVIGSKGDLTLKKVVAPASDKDLGSLPNFQNIACAMSVFCGD